MKMAAQDSNDARRFFVERIAKPRHIYLHGASYGGLVGAKLVETLAANADGSLNYDGAMFNSGAVGGATLNYQHRVDLRAVYTNTTARTFHAPRRRSIRCGWACPPMPR